MGLSKGEFTVIRSLVERTSGVVLSPEKVYLAEHRLAEVARAAGLRDLVSLVRTLRFGKADSQMEHAVVEAMLINETSFFRDAHPFEMLSRRLIPDRLQAIGGNRPLCIWSAAASTGQEPYSVAMIMRDDFPEEKSHIYGTDLSTAALKRARAGDYSQLEVNRGLPARKLVTHFRKERKERKKKEQECWSISDDLRAQVQFRRANLVEPWPIPAPVDIVLLRNVLVYFSQATRRRVLERLRGVMTPGAYLVLGVSETSVALPDDYLRIDMGRTVCFRLAGESDASGRM